MWSRLEQRVRTRTLQLRAWRHLMPRGVPEQAERHLTRVDWLVKGTVMFATIAAFAIAADAGVKPAGAVALAVFGGVIAGIPASFAGDHLRDKVLDDAFARMSPSSVALANVAAAPPFAASAAHKAKPAQLERVAKPKLSETDRDARDFDDAG